ncbi:Zinc carboxypeptidase A 1 [Sergentomyia squamirostris]
MKTALVTLAALACVCGFSFAEVARYDNYRIYSFTVTIAAQIKVIEDLDESSDSVIFLSKPSHMSNEGRVVVAPHKFADFEEILELHGISFTVLEKNIQRQMDMEKATLKSRKRVEGYDFENYHKLEEINDWLQSLEKKYTGVVSLINAGKSYEGRDILGVKISHGPNKPGVFIEAGIHAREWISPATIIFIVNELLTSKDEGVQHIAKSYDWYVFPSVNPDGYVYTHQKNRLWRKTRSPHGSCIGVDANRNWDFHWNEIGASDNPCSDTYSGPSAFSEPETLAISNYITNLKDKIHLYLSFHSFSQLIIFPYGHTAEPVENHKDLQEIGNEAAKALAKRYGTKYVVGDIYNTIYPASGTSIDWARGVLDISLSYCYELRPKNQFQGGFELPAKQIKPTSLETLDSLVALIKRSEELGYFSN